jgi:hypothetical protein
MDACDSIDSHHRASAVDRHNSSPNRPEDVCCRGKELVLELCCLVASGTTIRVLLLCPLPSLRVTIAS